MSKNMITESKGSTTPSSSIQNSLMDSKSPTGSSGIAAPASLVLSPVEVESPLPSIGFLSPDSNSYIQHHRVSGLSFSSNNTSNLSSTPTTAAQHLISDLVSNKDSNLRERIKKACSILSEYLQTFLNEISFTLYQLTDRIHTKLPKIVETKNKLNKCKNEVSLLNSDVKDIEDVINDLKCLDSLSKVQLASTRAVKAATITYNRRKK
ncbi:hypothetical protein K502DRAFT_324426 [Neoconidiobolus thromboides FSU 785]|nr:hypothetical protein K502DRAFT_324426 [Neoconidiobolus thromboides FSU 785]